MKQVYPIISYFFITGEEKVETDISKHRFCFSVASLLLATSIDFQRCFCFFHVCGARG